MRRPERFGVSLVNDMQNMFAYCINLQVVDLSTWTLKANVNCDVMFDNDTNLTTIFVGDGFLKADRTANIAATTSCSAAANPSRAQAEPYTSKTPDTPAAARTHA